MLFNIQELPLHNTIRCHVAAPLLTSSGAPRRGGALSSCRWFGFAPPSCTMGSTSTSSTWDSTSMWASSSTARSKSPPTSSPRSSLRKWGGGGSWARLSCSPAFHVSWVPSSSTTAPPCPWRVPLRPHPPPQPPPLIVQASQTLLRASQVRSVQHLSPLQQVVYFMVGVYIRNRQWT